MILQRANPKNVCKSHFWPRVFREIKCTHHLAEFRLTSGLTSKTDPTPTYPIENIPPGEVLKNSQKPVEEPKGRAKRGDFFIICCTDCEFHPPQHRPYHKKIIQHQNISKGEQTGISLSIKTSGQALHT